MHLYKDYQNYYPLIISLGKRLRIAMGEKEILSRNSFRGGEFRPPTYRAYAEAIDSSLWKVYNDQQNILYIVPYNKLYDGWDSYKTKFGMRSGFMASAVNSYEYAYEYWNEWTNQYYPDLFDDATFGAWLELLPQPASVIFRYDSCLINWNDVEPRVFRSNEMGRYTIPHNKSYIQSIEKDWRIARATAYVTAWEMMASNEPLDRYESIILAEQKILDKR